MEVSPRPTVCEAAGVGDASLQHLLSFGSWKLELWSWTLWGRLIVQFAFPVRTSTRMYSHMWPRGLFTPRYYAGFSDRVSEANKMYETRELCFALTYSSFVQQHNYTTSTGLCIYLHIMFSVLIAASYSILFLLYINNYFYYGLISHREAQFIVSALHVRDVNWGSTSYHNCFAAWY